MGLRVEDMAILSEELRMLMAAGLPLEASLARLASGRGRRLGKFLTGLSERLDRGEDLAAIVAAQRSGLPRMAAAALGAGLQSGKPGLALELLGEYTADVRQLRLQVVRAAAYPLAVAATASMLLMTVIQGFLDHYYTVTVVQGLASISPWLNWLLEQNSRHPLWVFVPFAAVLVLVGILNFSGRAAAMAFRGPERLLFLLPGIRMQVWQLQSYALTRMLSLLTSHQLPFALSLRLAGTASGSLAFERACAKVADGSAAGASAAGISEVKSLPPLLACCLRQADRSEQMLTERLRSTADYYRQQFECGQLLLQLVLPVVLFLALTAASVFTVAMVVFWPVVELYYGIG